MRLPPVLPPLTLKRSRSESAFLRRTSNDLLEKCLLRHGVKVLELSERLHPRHRTMLVQAAREIPTIVRLPAFKATSAKARTTKRPRGRASSRLLVASHGFLSEVTGTDHPLSRLKFTIHTLHFLVSSSNDFLPPSHAISVLTRIFSSTLASSQRHLMCHNLFLSQLNGFTLPILWLGPEVFQGESSSTR